jgi:hypothetical protein
MLSGMCAVLAAGFLLIMSLQRYGVCAAELRSTILLPEYEAPGDDVYLCTAAELPSDARSISRIEPKASEDVVHHMLMFDAPSS